MATQFPLLDDKVSDKEKMRWMRQVATRIRWGSFTWNAPNCPANTTTDTTLTTVATPEVDGLRVGMPVTVTPPSTLDAGLVTDAWVPADNQLTVRIGNITGGDINPASGTWAFNGILL